jgi:tRNA (guanine-N7-)-methyltransferase
MWTGATQSFQDKMPNVAFLRTHIELIDRFFAPGEVSEIWLTFPDPQMAKVNKRMTSTRFIQLYSSILTENGLIHLKTDSPFMYAYTCAMIEVNRLPVIVETDDLYNSGIVDNILSIQTFYEQQWISRGFKIKYVRFVCEKRSNYIEPEIDIEPDDYRSFNRNKNIKK